MTQLGITLLFGKNQLNSMHFINRLGLAQKSIIQLIYILPNKDRAH